jgi:hypothetical protein
VIVTSRSLEHMLLTYSLRTLVCNCSGYNIWLFISLMDSYDDVMDYDLCCLISMY